MSNFFWGYRFYWHKYALMPGWLSIHISFSSIEATLCFMVTSTYLLTPFSAYAWANWCWQIQRRENRDHLRLGTDTIETVLVCLLWSMETLVTGKENLLKFRGFLARPGRIQYMCRYGIWTSVGMLCAFDPFLRLVRYFSPPPPIFDTQLDIFGPLFS